MSGKFIKQNRTFLSIVLVLFFLAALILYFSANQIYEKEAKLEHKTELAQLLSAEEIVKVSFYEYKHNLFFLRDLPSTKDYVNNNFKSIDYKNKVENTFYEFAKAHKEYYQIRILDSSGLEKLRIDNKREGTTIIVPDSQLQDKSQRYYFQKTMQLDKDQIYVSPIDLNIERGKIEVPYVPVIRLATPLIDSKDRKKGILILNIYFSKILELLPKNVFIQTEEGNLISLNPDGSINFIKSNYNFSNYSGTLHISQKKTVHYSTVEFLPGKIQKTL